MTWRLTISWWEGKVDAKAKMKTKLKAEAKVTDKDLAPDNFLVGA